MSVELQIIKVIIGDHINVHINHNQNQISFKLKECAIQTGDRIQLLLRRGGNILISSLAACSRA